METAVEWLIRILEGQKDEPFDYNEWEIAFKHALDMEKQQIVKAAASAYEDMFGTDGTEYGEEYYNNLKKRIMKTVSTEELKRNSLAEVYKEFGDIGAPSMYEITKLKYKQGLKEK